MGQSDFPFFGQFFNNGHSGVPFSGQFSRLCSVIFIFAILTETGTFFNEVLVQQDFFSVKLTCSALLFSAICCPAARVADTKTKNTSKTNDKKIDFLSTIVFNYLTIKLICQGTKSGGWSPNFLIISFIKGCYPFTYFIYLFQLYNNFFCFKVWEFLPDHVYFLFIATVAWTSFDYFHNF